MSASRRSVVLVTRSADAEALRLGQLGGVLVVDPRAPEQIVQNAQALRDRVFLVPTAEPESHRVVERAAAALAAVPAAGTGPRVLKIVRLSDMAEGHGVADWLARGHTVAELIAAAHAAPAWTPGSTAPRGGLALVLPEDAAALPRAVRLLDAELEAPPSWLVPDLIPKGEPVLVAGEGGTMKTTLALHLACAAAAGGALFAHGAPIDSTPTLIVSGEDSRGVVANRCEAICRGHGWARERVLANLHVLALGGTDLAAPRWRAHLLAELERTGAGLVILDPLANLTSGDENSNTDLRPVVATWKALARGGVTAVLVHHAGKLGDGSRSKRDRIRGGTAIADGSRCTLFLEKAADGVTVYNVKQSRAPEVPAFAVTADVTTDAQNRAVWASARFTRTTQRRAAMTHAERVLLERIGERPGLGTNALTELVQLQKQAVSDALASLQAAGHIRYEPGPNRSKMWYATPGDAAPAGGSEWFPSGSHHSPAGGSEWFPSLEGGTTREPNAPAGSAGTTGDDEAAYLADERAALEDPAP